jgi:hypothetical protein
MRNLMGAEHYTRFGDKLGAIIKSVQDSLRAFTESADSLSPNTEETAAAEADRFKTD